MTEPISNEDLAGWREPGGEYEAVYAMIARIDAAEAEVARLREAERLLRWYVEDDLVEGGDAFGGWDDDVREFVEVAALAAPPDPKEPSE